MWFTAETRGCLKCKISPRPTWGVDYSNINVETNWSRKSLLGVGLNWTFCWVAGRGGGRVGRQPLVHLGLITETFRVECVLTAPSSWCNFLHSFSFFLKSSDVAFLFLLLSLAKSFLFIISASLLTAWIFIVLSIASCFFIFSVAPSFSLLMSLDFSRSRKKNGKKHKTIFKKWNNCTAVIYTNAPYALRNWRGNLKNKTLSKHAWLQNK